MSKLLLEDFVEHFSKCLTGWVPVEKFEWFVKNYEQTTEYTDINKSALWYLFRLEMRNTNYQLYDYMRMSYNCNDEHIFSMLKKSCKLAYGKLPSDVVCK